MFDKTVFNISEKYCYICTNNQYDNTFFYTFYNRSHNRVQLQ